MSAKLNEFQNASVGACAGSIEVLCLQPFNYAKNMIQQGKPFLTFDPFKLYRGVGANVINMGSCTMIQFAAGGTLKKMFGKGDNLSPGEELLCGIGAGAVSAFAGSPLELIMIQQQVKGNSTIAAIKSVATPKLFLRGFMGTSFREAFWTCGYFSIPPIIRTNLREKFPDTFTSDNKARVPAAIMGGLFACYLTQPFDTIKTCMQGDIEMKKFTTIRTSAQILYKEGNIPAFYRGATFRFGRMACAVFMLDFLKENISRVLYPHAFK